MEQKQLLQYPFAIEGFNGMLFNKRTLVTVQVDADITDFCFGFWTVSNCAIDLKLVILRI